MGRVFDAQSGIAPVVAAEGLRVFGGVRASSRSFRPALVDPSSGECLWLGTGEFAGANGTWNPRPAMRGDAMFVTGDALFVCVDAATGVERWRSHGDDNVVRRSSRWRRDGATDELAVDRLDTPEGERVVCLTERGELRVIDLHSGRAMWSDHPDRGSYEVVPGVGVLVWSVDRCAQLRDANGDTLWERPLCSALVSGQSIFAKVGDAQRGSALVCIDARTGEQRWHVDEAHLEAVDVGVGGDERATLLIAGGFRHKLWSVHAGSPPRTGLVSRLLGRAHGDPLPVRRATVASVSRVGDHAFVVVDSPRGKHLVVLDTTDGRPVAAPYPLTDSTWVHLRGQGNVAVARCERSDGRVVLRAFVADGRCTWERDVPEASEHFCLHGDVVLQLPRQLAVLDAATGCLRYCYAN